MTVGTLVAVVSLLLTASLSSAADEPAKQEELKISGMTYVVSHGSDNAYVIQAKQARINPESETASLKTVHVIMNQEQANGMKLDCEQGEIALATGNFHAKGGVRGTTADGRRFSTEWVDFDNDARVVSTTSPTLIEDATGRYRGRKGFRYLIDEERLDLFDPEVWLGP